MGILWAIIALVALGSIAGIIGWLQARERQRKIELGLAVEEETESSQSSGGCCGMHMTCERDSLLAAVSTKITYYDDEELDRYLGTSSIEYTAEATDEFREILITLDEDDVAGWVRSLQLRGLEVPEELKPELFLIIGENRAYHMEHGPGHTHDQKKLA